MTEPAGARDERSVTSLRRRVGRSFLTMLAAYLVLSGTLLAGLLVFKSQGDDVIERWQPANTLSVALLDDLVNQETGIRGFALSGRTADLDPYNAYVRRQRRDGAELRDYLAGNRTLVNGLEQVTGAANHWRTQYAEQVIAAVQGGDLAAAARVAGSAEANGAFDAVRTASARLTSDIQERRERYESGRRVAAIVVYGVFAGAVVLVIAFGVALWRGLRGSVLEPVESLAAQAREVATGSIGRRIQPAGPPELEALGADVDAMRARIADELARIEAARAELVLRTEDLARSNADLEQFAYVASHDLSEPLRKVANFCQLLERQYADQLDDKARQYIAFAVDGAKRMQILIADLLAFSRVGRSTEEFVDVDMNTVVARALANLDQRLSDSGAHVVTANLPTVPGDTSLLVALFQNLIGNSLKYRSEDPPQIEISARRDAGEWVFAVSDNGIGIDPKYSERIFAIFQRLHLRDQYGGTGIGLALCRKIVEFHGGRIWLAEHTGPGATFQFTLGAGAGGAGREPQDSAEEQA